MTLFREPGDGCLMLLGVPVLVMLVCAIGDFVIDGIPDGIARDRGPEWAMTTQEERVELRKLRVETEKTPVREKAAVVYTQPKPDTPVKSAISNKPPLAFFALFICIVILMFGLLWPYVWTVVAVAERAGEISQGQNQAG